MKEYGNFSRFLINNLPAFNLFTIFALVVSYQLYGFKGVFISAIILFLLFSTLPFNEFVPEFFVLLTIYVLIISLNALTTERKNACLPVINEGSSVFGTVVEVTKNGVFLESSSGKIFVRFRDYEKFLYSLASISTPDMEANSELFKSIKELKKLTKYAAVKVKVEKIVRKRVPKGFIEEPWIVYGKLKLRQQPNPFSALLWKLQLKVDDVLTKRSGIFEGRVLKGFLTGEKPYFDDYALVSLRRTGSLHLLAVSGLHIGILYLILDKLLSLLKINNWLAYLSIVKVIILASFLLFVGLPSSGMRAFLMILLYELSRIFLRNSKLQDILFAASSLIVLVNPSVIFDIGFHLSFLSVCGISFGLFLFERYESKDKKKSKNLKSLSYRWYKKTKEELFYSLSVLTGIQIFLLPLNIFYFKGFSLLGWAANIFVVPLAGPILTAAVLTLIFDFLDLGNLAALFGNLSRFLLLFLLKISSFFSRLPAAYIYLDLRGLEANLQRREVLFLLLLSVIVLIIFKMSPKTKTLLLAVFLFVLLLNIVLKSFSEGAVLIDVGQGTSLAIFSKEKTFLFDCGPPSAQLYEKLLRCGLVFPEQIFISHYHLDHIGGLPALISAFRFVKNGKLWLPPPQTSFEREVYSFLCKAAKNVGIKTQQIKNGLKLEDCSANLSVIVFDFSNEEKFLDPNFRSAVFLISFRNPSSNEKVLEKNRVNILYPSDCYSSTLERFNPKIFKLVIAPHHGSLTGYSESFYKNFRGEVFVSCGKNFYGLPSKEFLNELNRLGIKVRQTVKEGSIYWKPH